VFASTTPTTLPRAVIPPHDIENNDFLYSTSETNFTYTIKSEEEERRAKMTRKTDANTSANGLMDEVGGEQTKSCLHLALSSR
jgi:hypothetical protein